MADYPTPHINAIPSDFAKTVIMPGDPQRAEMIAKRYLENPVLINEVRGILGFTGKYQGKEVTVMASGMGMPSMGIYSYELFNIFGVENIIRVGSAGAYSKDVKLRDIILASAASTDSNYCSSFKLPGTFAPIADFGLLKKAAENAKNMNLPCHIGNILSTDVFYKDSSNLPFEKTDAFKWANMGIKAVEMEAAALYINAAASKKKALCICTVSDSLVTKESLSSDERRDTFDQMIKLALTLI